MIARVPATVGASALVAVAALVFAPACKTSSDEADIRALVISAAQAAGEHDASGVVDILASDFCGTGLRAGRPRKTPGCAGADLDTVRRLVVAQLLPRGWVRVFLPRVDVQLDGPDAASATVDAILARGRPVERVEDLLPANGDAYRFELELERREGGWRVVRADARRRRP